MINMDELKAQRIELAMMLGRLVLVGTFSYFTLKYMINAIDPTRRQKKDAQKKAQLLFEKLNIRNLKTSLNEYELVVASQLIDPSSINITWDNIKGLDGVINGIRTGVILPMKMPHLFSAIPNHRPPTGVLLHGPPGCGKTMLAKATAKEAGARFINLEVAMLIDKWYGESQKLAKSVFTLAKKLQPCIIFIDEIDSFLRSRNSQDHEATAMVKAQFMTLWDGLETDSDSQVIVMGATNRPNDVDRAILRRMPAMYAIGLPSAKERKEILKSMIDHASLHENVDLDQIAELTEEFSGSDLRELYRGASTARVEEYVSFHPELFLTHSNIMSPASTTSSSEDYSLINGVGGASDGNTFRKITMNDFINAIQKIQESRRLLGSGTGHSVIGID